MSRRKLWIIAGCGAALMLAAVVALGLWLQRCAVLAVINAHTQELAQWAEEDSKISSDADAFRTIEMMEYASDYYRAVNGYQGPKWEQEAMVPQEEQREKTLNRFAAALEKYTGLQYGRDLSKWKAWAASKGYTPRH